MDWYFWTIKWNLARILVEKIFSQTIIEKEIVKVDLKINQTAIKPLQFKVKCAVNIEKEKCSQIIIEHHQRRGGILHAGKVRIDEFQGDSEADIDMILIYCICNTFFTDINLLKSRMIRICENKKSVTGF